MGFLFAIILIGLFFIPGFVGALGFWLFQLLKFLFLLAYRFWQVILFVIFILFIASLF